MYMPNVIQGPLLSLRIQAVSQMHLCKYWLTSTPSPSHAGEKFGLPTSGDKPLRQGNIS